MVVMSTRRHAQYRSFVEDNRGTDKPLMMMMMMMITASGQFLMHSENKCTVRLISVNARWKRLGLNLTGGKITIKVGRPIEKQYCKISRLWRGSHSVRIPKHIGLYTSLAACGDQHLLMLFVYGDRSVLWFSLCRTLAVLYGTISLYAVQNISSRISTSTG